MDRSVARVGGPGAVSLGTPAPISLLVNRRYACALEGGAWAPCPAVL